MRATRLGSAVMVGAWLILGLGVSSASASSIASAQTKSPLSELLQMLKQRWWGQDTTNTPLSANGMPLILHPPQTTTASLPQPGHLAQMIAQETASARSALSAARIQWMCSHLPRPSAQTIHVPQTSKPPVPQTLPPPSPSPVPEPSTLAVFAAVLAGLGLRPLRRQPSRP